MVGEPRAEALPEQPALTEQLWLLLPLGMETTRTARQCLRLLRSQLRSAQMMQNLHQSLS